jgi:transcriptional regulator with XRE-family HTH domain
MTQVELAEKLAAHNLSNSWTQYKVSRIENGRTPPTVEDLLDLAEVQRMEHSWYLVGPSIPAGRATEANPGQLRSGPTKRRFRTSDRFRPSLGF